MTRCIRLGVAAVVVAALAGLTGCRAESPAATPSPAASGLGEAQIVAILEEHAQCVRDHGVAGFQPPRLADGRIQGKGEAPAGADQEAVMAALDACDAIARRLPQSLWRKPDPTAADLDKLRQLAACLRQHGFPDWPDPDARGRFAIRGTPMEQAVKGDSGRDAFDACRQYEVGFGMTEPQ
ncbi:hypothetical protein AB0J86_12575 [Micromonospora sp. NPDC049559]|uniref:hypothetical protein n=1 Tax=Micromonospora sp. NPDC049559 TaxID=3155923 RepID=UPI00341872A8